MSDILGNEKLMNYVMSAVCTGGGLYGYMQKASMPSLIAGIGFGALYGMSNYLISGGDVRYGLNLATLTSLVLAGTMAPRYMRTRGTVPLSLAAGGLLAAMMNARQSYVLKHQ